MSSSAPGIVGSLRLNVPVLPRVQPMLFTNVGFFLVTPDALAGNDSCYFFAATAFLVNSRSIHALGTIVYSFFVHIAYLVGAAGVAVLLEMVTPIRGAFPCGVLY